MIILGLKVVCMINLKIMLAYLYLGKLEYENIKKFEREKDMKVSHLDVTL